MQIFKVITIVLTMRTLPPDYTMMLNDAVSTIKPHAFMRLNNLTTTHN